MYRVGGKNMARESDLVHYGLNLTSIMKKSYRKGCDDVFHIQEMDISSMYLYGTSLALTNLAYFQQIVSYVGKVEKEMEEVYKRDITYKEIRYELRRRKSDNLINLQMKYEKECKV